VHLVVIWYMNVMIVVWWLDNPYTSHWLNDTWRAPKIKELLSNCFPSLLAFLQVSFIFKRSTCLILLISSSKALILLLSFISSYSIFIFHASFIYSSCRLFSFFNMFFILLKHHPDMYHIPIDFLAFPLHSQPKLPFGLSWQKF